MVFKKQTWILLIITIVSLFAYWKVFWGFFQQDEWLAFGFHYWLENEGFLSIIKNAFLPRPGHYSPFNLLLEQFFFSVFKLNYSAWAISSIILHILNSFLVFVLSCHILKDEKKALISSLIFVVSASIYQATAWPVADIGTHQAVFFALLALIFFLKYQANSRSKFFIVSMVCLFISLFFKETAIALFILLPLSYFLFGDRTERKIKVAVVILALGCLYTAARLSMLMVPQQVYKGTIYEQSSSVSVKPDYGDLIYNMVSYPFKTVTQSIVPLKPLLFITDGITAKLPRGVTGEVGTTQYANFSQRYVLEILNLLVFLLACFFAVRSKKIGIFLLLFIVLNSMVYSFSPERLGKITIVDSRNLYFPAVGSSMLLVFLIEKLKCKQLFIYVLEVGVVVANILLLYGQLDSLARVADTREYILRTIKEKYPVLPKKVVLFTQSDSSFYGLPEQTKIMPFQSGFGHTIIVWYFESERFPDEFLKKKFLWEITDQGYKQVADRGFGYYRDYTFLKNQMKADNLDPMSVIAFSYDSKFDDLVDITSEIRENLIQEKE